GCFIGQAGSGNVISGNSTNGIELRSRAGVQIFGNFIGVSKDGSADLGNGHSGIWSNSSFGNGIGGGAAGQRNFISGNTFDGIAVSGDGDNAIAGNYIGTDVTGKRAIPNDMD